MASSQAERQLILLSAGTAARRRAMGERAEGLMAEVDWPRLAETLRRRKLLPTLGPRILELATGRATDDFAATVEQALATGRRHGAFLQLMSLRAIAMLADAGIRSSALKGPLLGEAIYGDPGRRSSSDIDLLVSPEQLQTAAEVVRGLGYGAPTGYVYDRGLPLLHFVLVHERGELPPLELHWRVHWYEQSFARERLLPPAVDSLGEWRPAPADELAALLLFYARDGFVGLRLAADLGAWWDVHGADLTPGALDELLRAYPAFARVIPAALEVAERIVGLPATQFVGDMPRLGLGERMAVRLANPNPRSSPSQLYADMGLIDGLLMPRGGFGAFVRRQVLPPPEVLDQQARHAARRRARSSLGRGAGVVARYGLTMTHLMRAPETLH
jgi:Uncharacterised nucleotidyltransferase